MMRGQPPHPQIFFLEPPLTFCRLLSSNQDRAMPTSKNGRGTPRPPQDSYLELVYQQSLVRGDLRADCVEQDIQRALEVCYENALYYPIYKFTFDI